MEITIGHLYYDLMNLYGENGNIKVLEKQLKEQGIKVTIKRLSLDDKIDFNKLDLIYIGTGTENNQKIVLNNILQYKKEINDYYQQNKFFLITGNAIELFGKYIIDNDNNEYETLGIFNYYTKDNKIRTVKEIYTTCPFLKDNILGFMNHQGSLYDENNLLINNDGIYKNNFYGTYILGPILARNPEFMKYFIKKLIHNKDKEFKLKDFNTKLDRKAYLSFIAFKNNI